MNFKLITLFEGESNIDTKRKSNLNFTQAKFYLSDKFYFTKSEPKKRYTLGSQIVETTYAAFWLNLRHCM